MIVIIILQVLLRQLWLLLVLGFALSGVIPVKLQGILVG